VVFIKLLLFKTEVKMNKKRIIVAITVFSLLSGCGKVTTTNTTNTTNQNGQSSLVTAKTNSAVAKSPKVATNSVSITNDSAVATTKQTKDQPYSITTATFSQDNIKIQYPQIHGLGDNSKEKIINDLIKNDVLNSQVEAPIKYYQDSGDTKVNLTLDLKYQVKMNTNELLSVIYTGYSNIQGSAHPTNDIYTINMDVKNATKLKLSDFTTIDANLAEKIKQSTSVTNDAVKGGMDKNVLITAIKSMDDETLIQGLKDQEAYNTFYVTPDSLVVSVDVAHAIGDYALVELPGQYTKR
jgi:uncharacterized protein YceK